LGEPVRRRESGLSETSDQERVDDRPSQPRRLLATALATLAAVVAYWAVVIAVAAASDTGSVDSTTGIAVAIGFFLLPMAFLVLAKMSRQDRLVRTTVMAAGLGLVLWTWVPFIAGELLSPFAAALGCGGAVALRVDGAQRIRHRLVAVAAVTIYVFVVVRAAFGFALLVTPFLPLPAVLVADFVSERRSV
jgi:hypothetical protein